MTRYLPWLVLLLPFGSLPALALWIARRRRQERPDLVPRWRMFIESGAAKGEPEIPSAKVPPVQKPKAKVERIERYTRRFGERR